jgi:hypothetical protein
VVLAVIELPISVVERHPGLIDRIVELEPSKDLPFALPIRRRKTKARMRRGSENAGPNVAGERLQQGLVEKLLAPG